MGIGLGAQFYEEVRLSLTEGDLLILSSDGLVEAKNTAGEMFGFERLEQTLASGPTTNAESMLDHLKAKVTDFVGHTEPHDDMTIVVIQV